MNSRLQRQSLHPGKLNNGTGQETTQSATVLISAMPDTFKRGCDGQHKAMLQSITVSVTSPADRCLCPTSANIDSTLVVVSSYILPALEDSASSEAHVTLLDSTHGMLHLAQQGKRCCLKHLSLLCKMQHSMRAVKAAGSLAACSTTGLTSSLTLEAGHFLDATLRRGCLQVQGTGNSTHSNSCTN